MTIVDDYDVLTVTENGYENGHLFLNTVNQSWRIGYYKYKVTEKGTAMWWRLKG